MLKPERSICTTQNTDMPLTSFTNGKNDSKINSEMSSKHTKDNVVRNKTIQPNMIVEKNKMNFPLISGQMSNNDKKQLETSNIDFNGLDLIMNTMRNRIGLNIKNHSLASEKLKISRAINLLFKNNLSEFTLNDLKISSPIPNMSQNIVKEHSGTVNNVKEQNLSQSLSGNNKEKMLFTSVNEIKKEKNPPTLKMENNPNQLPKIENSNSKYNS